MKTRYASLMVSTLLCCTVQDVVSQGYVTNPDRQAIVQQVKSIMGGGFTVRALTNIDSSIGNPKISNGNIEDPHGTLAHCIIFAGEGLISASDYVPRGFVGIYKNGILLWHSDTLINDEVTRSPLILATTDLVNNGKVDIVCSWFGGASGGSQWLWVFEWDGQQGSLISTCDDQGNSKLVSLSHMVEFVDIDGNGVKEIVGRWPEEDSIVVYSWNGTLFGRWANGPEVQAGTYAPRSKLDANLRSSVARRGDTLIYHYTATNKAGSLQRINEIFIQSDTAAAIANPVGRQYWRFSKKRHGLFNWNNWFHFPNNIQPGSGDSSFSFESRCLPGIRSYFVRGDNQSTQDPRYEDSKWYQDILENSLASATVSPVTVPPTRGTAIFLDTLHSYINQSRTLGWITDQSTAERYSRVIDSAQKALAENKIRSVRSCLQTAIQHSAEDSAKTISSEAYALIRFNAEYLIGQLPPLPAAYTVTTSMSGRGTIVKTPDAAEYDSASSIVLAASPDSGYSFTGWSGDVSSTDNPLTVQMVRNITVTAAFVPPTPSLSAISPALALPCSSPMTLTLSGHEFLDGATVKWNGAPRPTTVASHSILKSTIPAGDLSAVDSVAVTVYNPGGKDSDPLTFSVVQTLPFGLRPDLDDLTKNRDGSMTAWFGYRNDNSVDIFVPVGASNMVAPSPSDRGQPTTFLPGKREKVFSVRFTGGSLKWTLNGTTETAIGKQNKGQ